MQNNIASRYKDDFNAVVDVGGVCNRDMSIPYALEDSLHGTSTDKYVLRQILARSDCFDRTVTDPAIKRYRAETTEDKKYIDSFEHDIGMPLSVP
jgi:hypothetical protein